MIDTDHARLVEGGVERCGRVTRMERKGRKRMQLRILNTRRKGCSCVYGLRMKHDTIVACDGTRWLVTDCYLKLAVRRSTLVVDIDKH